MLSPSEHRRLVRAAQGEVAPDLLVTDGVIVNVYSGELLRGDVGISGGRIAFVGPRPSAREPGAVLSAGGRYVIPGLIESHTHSFTLYNPLTLAAFGAARGTTTIVSDAYLFQRFLDEERIGAFLDYMRSAPVRLLWWLRGVGWSQPSEHDAVLFRQLDRFVDRPDVAGLAEIVNWARITGADDASLRPIARALRAGKRVDGHGAGASPRRLMAMRAAGTSACHEAINGEEALTRLRLGYWTNLRFSSLRPDDLVRMVARVVADGVDTRRLLLTMDGSSPQFMARHGFMDACLRAAVEAGLPPVQAVQAATVNAATYLGLDDELGGIAPGRRADVCIVRDLRSFEVEAVVAGGACVARDGRLAREAPAWDFALDLPGDVPPALWQAPERLALPARHGDAVPVMAMENAVITRRRDMTLPVADGRVDLTAHEDLCHVALVAEGGRSVAHGVAQGLHGADALASTFTAFGRLLVTGRDLGAMAEAARLAACGGIVVVHGGRVRFHLPLPHGGSMSDLSLGPLAQRCDTFVSLMRGLGYAHGDPVFTLNFLSADSIPELKVTPTGLVESKTARILLPPEPVPS